MAPGPVAVEGWSVAARAVGALKGSVVVLCIVTVTMPAPRAAFGDAMRQVTTNKAETRIFMVVPKLKPVIVNYVSILSDDHSE